MTGQHTMMIIPPGYGPGWWDVLKLTICSIIADSKGIMPLVGMHDPGCAWYMAGTLVSCGRDNVVKVVDLRMFEARATLKAPGFAVGAVWTNACLGPDERHAAAGESDGLM